MKTPLRVQVSEYDCVPTSFVNALAYLFDRGEIPPLVLQRVYMLSLDCMFHTKEHGQGTSDVAIQFIASWLSEFRSTKFKNFRVEAEYVEGKQLHLGPRSKLVACLKARGVGVLSVKHFGNYWHEILALKSEDRWLYAFDPYPKSQRRSRSGEFEFLEPDSQHGPNLRIHHSWLDTASDKLPFRLGLVPQRGGVLIRRVEV
jgi:hypothetical protein